MLSTNALGKICRDFVENELLRGQRFVEIILILFS